MAQTFDYSNGSVVVQGGIIYYSPNCTGPVARPVYSLNPFILPTRAQFLHVQTTYLAWQTSCLHVPFPHSLVLWIDILVFIRHLKRRNVVLFLHLQLFECCLRLFWNFIQLENFWLGQISTIFVTKRDAYVTKPWHLVTHLDCNRYQAWHVVTICVTFVTKIVEIWLSQKFSNWMKFQKVSSNIQTAVNARTTYALFFSFI